MTVACQVILGKEHHGGLSFGNTKIKHRKKLGVAIMKRFFALFLAFILLFWVIGLMVGCAQKPPAITIVDPDMASLDGGSEITITAIGLKRNSVPTVTIGGNLATGVKFLSKWSLSAIIPPSNTAGPADIVVQNAKAKVKSLPFKGFSYCKDVTVVSTIPDFAEVPPEGIKAPSRIKVIFNQDVDPASVAMEVTSDVGSEVNGIITHDFPSTKMFVFTPNKPFKAGYHVLKISNAKGVTAGNVMTNDYTVSFLVKGKTGKKNIISKSDNTSRGYIGGSLSPSDNGYAWRQASKDERMRLCKSFEQSIGGFSATWYYRALKAFYDVSDSSDSMALSMTISQAASLMYVGGRNQ
jgi:hypothetical protein